ncbi:MAG TPA: DUF2550 family protein [Solirubrobacteraceae bacterium]
MLIALLAVLGVDLIVIVVLLALMLARRRWVKRQPDSFRGAIRLSGGEIDDLGPKWRRGYGRWVSDVLVWTKAPFLFRHAFVAASGLNERRPARPDEVKRLGDHPIVIQLRMGGATVEVAAPDDEGKLLLGPYAQAVAAEPTPVG